MLGCYVLLSLFFVPHKLFYGLDYVSIFIQRPSLVFMVTWSGFFILHTLDCFWFSAHGWYIKTSPNIDPAVHVGFLPKSVEQKLLCIEIIQKHHNHSSYLHHRSQKLRSISSMSVLWFIFTAFSFLLRPHQLAILAARKMPQEDELTALHVT